MARRYYPSITTAVRTANTPQEREYLYDTDENRPYAGDGSTVGAKAMSYWTEPASTFTSGDATPSVADGHDFVTSGSTAITNFDDGTANQVITVYRGDSDIVITDNANIDPIISGNITLSATRPSASFRLVSSVWKEVAQAGLVSSAMTPVVQAATTAAGRDALGVPRLGVVTMVHKTSQVWTVYLPDGSELSTTGTTTQGLQEAINWCDANAYPLFVYGGGVIDAGADDPASKILCTTPLTIPAGWGNYYYFYGVDLWYLPSEASTNDFITFESADYTTFHLDGEIVYSGDGAVLRFLPTVDNGESFIGWTSSSVYVKTIAIVDQATGAPETTHGTGVRWTPGAYAIINCKFEIGEINGGEKAFIVNTPTGTEAFRDNLIIMPGVHANATGGEIGGASTAYIFGNQWHLNLNPGAGTALLTYARNDSYFLSIASATTGVNFGAGATDNLIVCSSNSATTPYAGAMGACRIIDANLEPSVTVYTSGSGTYTTPNGAHRLEVECVGAGGGGGGSGTGGSQTAGSNGADTTFGSITAGGGVGGLTSGIPPGNGTSSGGDFTIPGGRGHGAGAMPMPGASGGNSAFGGGSPGSAQGTAAYAPTANSGGGGGSGSGNNAATLGVPSGGTAGDYVRKTIVNPSATYSYAVGAGGAKGAAGTSGFDGSDGAAGIIIVRAFFD